MRGRGLGVSAMLVALAIVRLCALGQGDCTREYKGDLVLTGDQRLVITEGTLCVHGDVVLRDNARLDLTNATLRMTAFTPTVWESWAHIAVGGNAQLALRNVRIEAPGSGLGGIWIHVFGSAGVRIEAVRPQGDDGLWINVSEDADALVVSSWLKEIRVSDRARAEVRESRIEGTVNLQFRGSSRAELHGLRSQTYVAWDLAGSSAQLALRNTHVNGWSVEVFDRSSVVVRDSVVARVIVEPERVPRAIAGMKPGHHSTWRLQDAMDAESTGNLELANTFVGSWILNLHGVRSPLSLSDSRFTGLYIWDSSARIRVEEVVVEGLVIGNSFVAFESGSLTVMRGMELRRMRLDLTGNVLFQYTVSRLVWEASSVVREHEVRVRDRAGQPARGVHLRLEDPSGGVTTHTTDQDGVLRFTIRFDDTNYDKTWHLITLRGDEAVRVPISLLTSTPVTVSAW